MLGDQGYLTISGLLEQEQDNHGQERRIGNCWSATTQVTPVKDDII